MSLTGLAQRMSKTSFQRLVLGLVFEFLVGRLVPARQAAARRVVDRNSAAPQKPTVTTGQYVVRKGDTMFSIAFRYGWDYKALAARNNIPVPYTIHPGQTIRFDGRTGSTPDISGDKHHIFALVFEQNHDHHAACRQRRACGCEQTGSRAAAACGACADRLGMAVERRIDWKILFKR